MIGIYERVSSKGQDLASQHFELEAYAARQEVPIKWFSDKFTGKTMDRPGIEELLAEIRAGRIRKLVVYRLDRLGRTAKGLTALFEELQTLRCGFVSLKEGVDLSTPAGRLIANVLASVAAFETEVRAERQAAGIQAAKARGQTWGGRRKGTMQKRTKQLDALVRKLHREGESIASISRNLKLSRPTLYKILKEAV